MLTVYKYIPLGDAPDMSPFAIKLETWLRMAGIAYEPKVGDPRRMPKGKLPCIESGGQILADSGFIIEHLAKKHGDPLSDARFNASDRAVARALASMCETDLYFAVVYQRWITEHGFAAYRPTLLEFTSRLGVPGFARPLVVRMLRGALRKQLFEQGMGRHTHDEVMAIGRSRIEALSDFLAEKAFIMDEMPCTVDATVYGLLCGVLDTPFESAFKDAARSRKNLVDYCGRVRERYWKQNPTVPLA